VPVWVLWQQSADLQVLAGPDRRYMAKVSGPLVDRIDIHIDVPAVAFSKLRSKTRQIDSETLRASVTTARSVQKRRFGSGKVLTTRT